MIVWIYCLLQWTWGILQTLVGLIVFLCHIKSPHYSFHGSIVTRWNNLSSVSLGMFLFVADEPLFFQRYCNEFTKEELSERLLVHEFGHSVQSLLLGPLYLILMGIPSSLWGFLPFLIKMRHEKRISYFSFFTESWANSLGEKWTGKKSMETLLIE